MSVRIYIFSSVASKITFFKGRGKIKKVLCVPCVCACVCVCVNEKIVFRERCRVRTAGDRRPRALHLDVAVRAHLLVEGLYAAARPDALAPATADCACGPRQYGETLLPEALPVGAPGWAAASMIVGFTAFNVWKWNERSQTEGDFGGFI